jgi:phosphatidate cytidylyltransferase
MKRIVTAALLIPLVLLLLFFAPHPLFAAVLGVVALLTCHEFLGLAAGYGIHPFNKTTLLFVALYFAGLGFADTPWALSRFGGIFLSPDTFIYSFDTRVFPLILLVMGLACIDLAAALPAAGYSYLAFPYIALTLGCLVHVRHIRYGALLLLYFLVLIWMGDICAYYVGRAAGKRPMAPVISPKKTWAGALASFLGALAAGGLLFAFIHRIGEMMTGILNFQSHTPLYATIDLHAPPLWMSLLFAALINLAAQSGDLVESMMKRGAKVKDSGALLPGHGGLLDRIDAMLLAAPVLWYYAPFIIQAITPLTPSPQP